MIVWLLMLWLAVMAFYGYSQLRRVQDILDDEPLYTKGGLTPKEYGLRYGNGKSRVKKSNRLRYCR